MAGIGTLYGILRMKTGPYDKAMRNAQRSASLFSKKMLALGGTLVAVAGARGFGQLIRSSADAGEAVLTTAQKLGVTVQELQELRAAAAEFSNIGAAQFDTALQRLTRRVAEAANGTGEAKAAIAELGLEATELVKKSPAQAFLDVADAMQKVDEQGNRVRLSFKLFDTEGVALVNTLSAGRGEIERIAERYRRLGAILDLDVIARAKATKSSLREIGAAQAGLATGLTTQLAPTLVTMSNLAIEAAEDLGLFGKQGVLSARGIAEGFFFLLDVFEEIKGALIELGAKIADIGAGWLKVVALMQPQIGRELKIIAAEMEKTADFARFAKDKDFWATLLFGKPVDRQKLSDKARATFEEVMEGIDAEIEKLNKRGLDGPTTFDLGLDEVEEAANRAGDAITNNLTDAIVKGGEFKDVLKNIGQELLTIALRTAVTGPLGQAIGGVFTGVFGGGKALGGPVSRGVAYKVGERGEEMFIPQTDGLIIPNNKINEGGFGGAITVNQVLNVSTGVQETVRAEIVSLLPALRKNAVQAVDEARVRRKTRVAT